MEIKGLIRGLIEESVEVKKRMFRVEQIEIICAVADKIVEAYGNNRKTIVCGNGGSASDALHFAAEMLVRFEKNRRALPSIALPGNVSAVTAAGNDFGYDSSFSRQFEAFVQKGDVLIAISASGTSPNIIKTLESAKKRGVFAIGMTNSDGGKMKDMCDLCYFAPSKVTARVQECHILLIHIVAKIVEEKIFN